MLRRLTAPVVAGIGIVVVISANVARERSGGLKHASLGAITPSSGDYASELRVVVRAGPDAGTYVASSDLTTCSQGLVGQGVWGNQYTDPGAPSGLTSVQLIVPRTPRLRAGTNEFSLGLSFEGGGRGRHYLIESRAQTHGKTGVGTATVLDNGTGARVSVRGRTGDGVTIEVTIVCNRVWRM